MAVKKEYVEFHIKRYSPSFVSLGFDIPEFGLGTLRGELLYSFEKYTELYICPLCATKVIYRDEKFYQFQQEHNLECEFTKDHFPPQSVGGGNTILVCKECNNNYGSTIESDIVKYLYSRAVSNGSILIPYPATLIIDGLPGFANVRARISNKNNFQVIIPKANKRVSEFVKAAARKQEITSKGIGFSLQLKPPPENSIFCRALLKSAFLTCFHTWGYDFVFSPTGEMLREIINGSRVHPSKSYGIYFLDINYIKDEGIYSFSIGDKIQLYLVVIKLELIAYEMSPEYVGVVIPGNSNEGWKSIVNLPLHKQAIKLTAPLYKIPNYLDWGHYFAFKGGGKMYNQMD